MTENPLDLLPELLLLGGALATLVSGLFSPRRRQYRAGAVAGATVLAALIASIAQWTGPTRMAFEDSYRVDGVTGAVRCIVTVSSLLLLALFRSQFKDHARETEAYVLLLLAALGAITLAGANDLLLLMGAFTVASVPLYALTGFGKDSPGTEAAMKYYLMGALFGIVLLTGITVLFGLAGQSAYPALPAGLIAAPPAALVFAVVAVVAGLSFKTGAVPVHFWVPDVAEGAGAAVAAAVTTLPKVGGLAAMYRLFDTALLHVSIDWRLLLAVVAVASMTLGNFAAFFQDKTRRLLGYSTISQVGYLMVPLVVLGRVPQAGTVLLFYLAAYALTNIGVFAVVAALPHLGDLGDYRGLGRSQPALVLA
ncbi:MAG: NADH-quinone oxidoreductase subunit N, partial [Actinomycetota bacterium]|nr:NADH-quinone oxidoreductase subunit N [Actinomycetota bacterium]